MIYIINIKEKVMLTMEIITHTNILCLPLPNGLIQLNKISTGEPDLFVIFLVCLLAKVMEGIIVITCHSQFMVDSSLY